MFIYYFEAYIFREMSLSLLLLFFFHKFSQKKIMRPSIGLTVAGSNIKKKNR